MDEMVSKDTVPLDGTPGAEPLPADFEQALAELERLAARMGEGGMALEESIAAYERGIALARVCQQRLAAAEQQVSVLQGQLLGPLAVSGGPGES